MGNVIFLLTVMYYVEILATGNRKWNQNNKNEKIIGGDKVDIKNFPYMAAIHLIVNSTFRQRCCGSIISNKYILTAAHCFDKTKRGYFRIASTMYSSGGLVYDFDYMSIIINPSYNFDTLDFDVAVIKSFEPMQLNLARAIPLIQSEYSISAGTLVNLTGWGTTSTTETRVAEHLMGVTVPTITNEKCVKLYRGIKYEITNRMFCNGYSRGGKDSCAGDSGGPVVTRGKQIGIVSFGEGCALSQFPGVNTRIPNKLIRNWIKKHTGV